jgi:hypothetical protein
MKQHPEVEKKYMQFIEFQHKINIHKSGIIVFNILKINYYHHYTNNMQKAKGIQSGILQCIPLKKKRRM